MADSPGIPVYNTGLRKTAFQEVVPFNVYYVHCMDRVPLLHYRLDDYDYW